MTPVTPYLHRYATALLLGAILATFAVNLAPAFYYDLIEWQLLDLSRLEWLRLFSPGLTPETLMSSFFMAFFFLLLGKELWEALVLERGRLHGRRAFAPLAWIIGGIIGAISTWLLVEGMLETAQEAADAPGWLFPIGGGIVVSFLFGLAIFGPAHPALQVLLFLTVIEALIGLLMTGIFAPINGSLQLIWLILPIGAALTGYYAITRALKRPEVTEVARQRAQHLWPWLVLGLISWVGVSAAGLPPALGFLPILPAMPHSTRSFGLFAEAEGLLTDPLNRLEHLLMPPVTLIMFGFGLTRGGVDLAAFGATSLATFIALSFGKPLGVLLVAGFMRLAGFAAPQSISWRATVLVSALMGIGFSVPLLTMETTLPGGALQEAARFGLALTLLSGGAVWGLAKIWKPRQ